MGSTRPYPTPIHDVALAYEWIINWAHQHLVPPTPNDTTPSQLRITLTGVHLSGSLALALALTECRITTPARITSVIVQDPILDWVFDGDPTLRLDTSAPDRETDAAKRALHALRRACFKGRYPYTHFDPFASPLHFLRSPSRRVPAVEGDIPVSEDSDEDVESGGDTEEEVAQIVGAPDMSVSSADGQSVKRAVSVDDPRRFKRPLRYPPSSLAGEMVLPDVCVVNARGSLLRGQAEEFVRLLRRGLVRGRGYKMGRELERLLVAKSALEEAVEMDERRVREAESHSKDERLDLVKEGWRRFELEGRDTVEEAWLADWLSNRREQDSQEHKGFKAI